MSGIGNREFQPEGQNLALRLNDKNSNERLRDIWSRNNLGLTIVSVTADYTALVKDAVIFVDATSGNVIVTLTYANSWGSKKTPLITVIRTDATTNTVTVTPQSTDTINTGSAGVGVLIQQGMYDFISNSSTAWWYFGGKSMFGITPKVNGLIAPIGSLWAALGITTAALAATQCYSYADTSGNNATTSYTDVINYTGSGVCDFLAHFGGVGADSLVDVIVDGVTILALSGTTQSRMYGIIGSVTPQAIGYATAGDSTTISCNPGTPIIFNTSFQVRHKLAGAGAACYTLLRMHKIT